MRHVAAGRTPGAPDLLHEIGEVVLEPEKWLKTPNDRLGGREPNDLIGTPDERLLRNLVQSIKHGMVT